jgi:hypothetical protein
MSDDPYTVDDGRIVVEDNLRESLWRGRRGDEEVVVALGGFSYALAPDFFDGLFRFDVPGIAPLAFLGYPDGAKPTADELRALRREGKDADAVLAEVRPDGEPLVTVAPLAEAAAVRLGIELCDVMCGWIERRGHALVGIHPDTLYVDDDERYTGATPRVFALLGNDSHHTFDPAYYGGPLGPSERELGDTDAAFVVALLVWFAATGEHAIRHHGYLDNPRPAFRGSAPLGAALTRALAGMNLAELRDALRALDGAAIE